MKSPRSTSETDKRSQDVAQILQRLAPRRHILHAQGHLPLDIRRDRKVGLQILAQHLIDHCGDIGVAINQ
jgi:hypothetical protein